MKGTVPPVRPTLLLVGVFALIAASAWATGTHKAAVPSKVAVRTVARASAAKKHSTAVRASVAPVAKASPTQFQPGEAGMRIYRDAETGETTNIRPTGTLTPESYSERLNDSSEGLVQETLPDGSVMVNLQGRFQEYMMIQQGPSGLRSVRCTQSPATPLKSIAAPAVKLEER